VVPPAWREGGGGPGEDSWPQLLVGQPPHERADMLEANPELAGIGQQWLVQLGAALPEDE